MNKKLNTVWFTLAATLLNILILLGFMSLSGVAFLLIFRNAESISTGMSLLAVGIIFFGSIAATFFVYSKIIKWVSEKWHLEDYIEPIFKLSKKK